MSVLVLFEWVVRLNGVLYASIVGIAGVADPLRRGEGSGIRSYLKQLF